MINFTITEDEYNALDDTRGQLNLLACLVGAVNDRSGPYPGADLGAFLNAQAETLDRIKKALDQRCESERKATAEAFNFAAKQLADPIAALVKKQASAMLAKRRTRAAVVTKLPAKTAVRKRDALAAKQLRTVVSCR